MNDYLIKQQRVMDQLIAREVVCRANFINEAHKAAKAGIAFLNDTTELDALLYPTGPDNTDKIDIIDQQLGAIDHRMAEISHILDTTGDIEDQHVLLRNEMETLNLKGKELEAERERLLDAQDEIPEIYEYWVVSSWAGEKLKELNEIVEDVCGLTVWGRQCSGQSISMDSVWIQIAGDMEILPGQENDWSKESGTT